MKKNLFLFRNSLFFFQITHIAAWGFLSLSLVFISTHSAAQKFSISKNIVKRICFYGGASDRSSYEILQNGRYYFKLINSNRLNWGSVGIDLIQPYDLQNFNRISFKIKGRNGGERFQVILRDVDWTNYNVPECNSPPIPEKGLESRWSYVHFNLDDLEGDVDLSYLDHIAIEIGSINTDNPSNAGIFIKDIYFNKAETLKPAPAIIQHNGEDAVEEVSAPVEPVEYYGPPLPPLDYSPSKDTNFNIYTVLGMGCVIFFGGLFIRKRSYRLNGNGNKSWLYPLSKPCEFPLIHAPKTPVGMIYEINSRAWGAKQKHDGTVKIRCFDYIPSKELKKIRNTGFDTIWMMGVWEISGKAREISQWYGDDFYGSPYAIPEYKINHELGGEEQFLDFVNRAHKLDLKVIVDFVPNHMALDSRWIQEHPEYFISFPLNNHDAKLNEKQLLDKFPGFYPAHTESFPTHGRRVKKRIMIAYGKDPNFFPWIDTAQLDYTNPRLRLVMINLLKYWAKIVDGVRCDTVMLVLREQIKHQWQSHISWEYFDRLFPEEFWLEAIQEVKRINPHFSFIAETYWNKESYLQQIGFDFTYDKTIYDLLNQVIRGDDPWKFQQYVRAMSSDYLSKSIHFLENHDEERAAKIFGIEGQKAAAVCIAGIPGVPLIHQGQMKGKLERLPVQRIIPKSNEPPDYKLLDWYDSLLKICAHPAFRQGSFYILNSTNSDIFTFYRKHKNTVFFICVNLTNSYQKTNIYIPNHELSFHPRSKYMFTDLYYPLKTKHNRSRAKVKHVYRYYGTYLIDNGLYVELGPYDAHIFLIK
ncbi:MAG: alpha-amylase family glycosyl hydrolase [bacterium]